MIRNLLLIPLVLITGLLRSQTVTIEAYAPNIVEVGEQFRLTYTLNARPSAFNPPSISNFEIIAGPSTSSSTSIEMINGKVTQAQSYTYTYILQASSEGKFALDPAEATIGKETVKSNGLTIEVVKSSGNSNKQVQQQNYQQAQRSADTDNLPNDDLFATIELSKKTAYVGEPIEATIKIYTRVNIVGFEDAKFPTFDNFWSQELESPNNINFPRTTVNGKIYSVGIIRKYLIFPQKANKIEIDPFEIVAIYQGKATRSQSIFDDFFGGVENYRKKLVSKPVTINIKPLPSNAPASFIGAVGSYKIDASIDKTNLKTNQAVTVKLKVSGSGNIKLIGTPKVEFPASFELFEPKVTDNINTNTSNATGSKSYEYIAIPRSAGKFEIPSVEFTYFDLSKESYVTLRSNPMNIEVTADSTSSGVMITGYNKEDVKFIGKDIRYIKTGHAKLHPLNSFVVNSALYICLYILLIIAFVIFWIVFGKHREQMANINLVRNKKANKIAQKRLKEAYNMLQNNNSEKFYEEIHKALWGYASDKLSISYALLTSERVKDELTIRDVDNSDIEEFIRIIDMCEYARFAPASEHSQMNSLYDSAYSLISRIEQSLGKVKSKLW